MGEFESQTDLVHDRGPQRGGRERAVEIAGFDCYPRMRE